MESYAQFTLKNNTMSAQLRECLAVLDFVASIKVPKLRQQLLKVLKSQPKYYIALREIAYNTVRKNLILSSKEKQRLKKHKRVLVDLAKKQKSAKKKKKLVEQSGGFLPILLPLVASLLSR